MDKPITNPIKEKMARKPTMMMVLVLSFLIESVTERSFTHNLETAGARKQHQARHCAYVSASHYSFYARHLACSSVHFSYAFKGLGLQKMRDCSVLLVLLAAI